MDARIRARLTPAAGRRFGLTLGCAFLVLALAAWYRNRLIAASLLGFFSGALLLAAAIAPTRLGPIESAWMKLAHAISLVTTPLVMVVIYFVILTPVGLLRRSVAGNPLSHRLTGGTYWKSRPEGERRSRSMERQF